MLIDIEPRANPRLKLVTPLIFREVCGTGVDARVVQGSQLA